MRPTTVKLSIETRARIRALGGKTYEDTIVEALDALEASRFWERAEAAAAWRRSIPIVRRNAMDQRDVDVDDAFVGTE